MRFLISHRSITIIYDYTPVGVRFQKRGGLFNATPVTSISVQLTKLTSCGLHIASCLAKNWARHQQPATLPVDDGAACPRTASDVTVDCIKRQRFRPRTACLRRSRSTRIHSGAAEIKERIRESIQDNYYCGRLGCVCVSRSRQ